MLGTSRLNFHAHESESTTRVLATCSTLAPFTREPSAFWRASLDASSATGQLRLLEYIPDRSKQQGRRFPLASISQAFPIRFMRVSSRLADSIHWIQSLRATGVMSDHTARTFGWAAASAFRRSAGILGSGSSPTGAISSETSSPASAPAASCNFQSTLSQWPPWPSGSSVARKGWPLMRPSTVVIPRVGSFELASFGRIRKVHRLPFGGSAGRKSLALKRIFEVAFTSGQFTRLADDGSPSVAKIGMSSLIGSSFLWGDGYGTARSGTNWPTA